MPVAYLQASAIGHSQHQALDTAHPKEWQTARAQATLAGWASSLGWTDDGRPELLCSRWAQTIAFDDLEAFNAWLRRVQGPRW